MRTVFLADAHLHHPDDSNYQLLLHFISSLKGRVDTLCILGDLFDFRIGLPSLAFSEHEPLLSAIRNLSDSGIRLIYLEGNHDFHLGSELAKQLGAEIYPKPVLLELHGKQVFLCHGDLVNRADWRYRLLHFFLRNRITARIGRVLPSGIVGRLRKKLQKTSKKRYSGNIRRWDYKSIISRFGFSVRADGADAVVLGHFHMPFIEKHDNFTLVSLGDWITQFSYAEMLDDSFELCSIIPDTTGDLKLHPEKP